MKTPLPRSSTSCSLIRNRYVNDRSVDSGNEPRSADVIRQYLGTDGLDLEVVEPAPGRARVVARIDGSDPSAASLLLLGHTRSSPSTSPVGSVIVPAVLVDEAGGFR